MDAGGRRNTMLSRLLGIVVTVSIATTAAALTVPKFPFSRDLHYRSGVTIYPWWIWALIAAGMIAGLVMAGWPGRGTAVRSGASAVAFVAAAQLAGTGIVGRQHWRPATGIGGVSGEAYADLPTYERIALLMGVLGLLAAAAALVSLPLVGALVRSTAASVRIACVAVGLATIVIVPLAIVPSGANGRDLTSWGAVGLIYAGPWGAALIVAGWLSRPAAVAMAVATLGSILLAFAGPQMADLIPTPRGTFGLAGVGAVVVLVLLVSAGRPRGPRSPQLVASG
jgi:hypothetical protein